MIVTFYSFKGGVGRSMALANVADIIARRGRKVLMIDFDLEAPGLEEYFQINQAAARRHEGLLDLLLSYKRSMSVAAGGSGANDFNNLSRFIVPVYETLPGGGHLAMMPAGQRESREQLDRYASQLRTFDWQDFYVNWEGELFFEWLRSALVPKPYDLVIVDSRTGVTEMGGICTYQLADAVVMLTAANHQNRGGTVNVANDFQSGPVQFARRDRRMQVLVVPARIEQRDPALLESFVCEFERQFHTYLPDVVHDAGLGFRDLLIPYEPAYAFEERVISDPSRTADRRSIVSAFERLADAVCALAGIGTAAPAMAAAIVPPLPAALPPESQLQFDAVKRFAGYDVFLSYAADDGRDAQQLAAGLDGRGLHVFEDRRDLAAGEDWRARTEHALLHSRVCLVCFGARGLSQAQLAEVIGAFDAIAASRDLSIVPVLLPGASVERFRAEAPPRLQRVQWLDVSEGTDSEITRRVLDSFAAFHRRAATMPPPPAAPSEEPSAAPHLVTSFGAPYPGAKAFAEPDARFWFGRDGSLRDVLEHLGDARLVLVTGASGCGKTSLIEAGVLPVLRASDLPLAYERLVAGPDVMADLEGALERLRRSGTSRQLLFVDDLERLLRISPADRRSFFTRITDVLAQPPELQVILAVRDADEGALLADAPAGFVTAEHRVVLRPFAESDVRAIIERAAERAGLAFEPGLVDRIVQDWGQDQRYQRFMQLVLRELWKRRREGFLTNKAYDEIPDPVEAVAETAWSHLPSEGARDVARQIIPRLLTLASVYTPERSCRPEDLLLPAMDRPTFDLVVRHMTDAGVFYSFAGADGLPRLSPTFVPEQWDRAARWMEEDAPFLEWLTTVDRCRLQWESSRDAEALLPGKVLKDGEPWNDRLSISERSFVEASRQIRASRRRVVRGVAAAAALLAGVASFATTWLQEGRHTRALSASAAYVEDADRLEAAGDLSGAVDAYTQAIDATPDNTAAWLRRGKALERLQRLDEAVRDYSTVIATIPDASAEGAAAVLADAHLARGDARLRMARYEDALADFDTAATYLNDGAIQAKRAAVLDAQLNRPDDALRAYEEALRLTPDLADAAFARGALLERLGRNTDAAKAFAAVANMASASPSTQLAARSRLASLGEKTVPPSPPVTRVVIHVTDAGDQSVADALRAELDAKAYETPPARLIALSVSGDVRYFFKEDARTAEEVRAIAEYIVAARGFNVRLPARYLVEETAQRGTIELWLPSLSAQVLPADVRRQAITKK